jgi:hypothetical protein
MRPENGARATDLRLKHLLRHSAHAAAQRIKWKYATAIREQQPQKPQPTTLSHSP